MHTAIVRTHLKQRQGDPHPTQKTYQIYFKQKKIRNTDNLNNVFIYYKQDEHSKKNRRKTPLAIFHFDFRYYLYFLCHFKRERFGKSFSFFFVLNRVQRLIIVKYVRGRQMVTHFVCVCLCARAATIERNSLASVSGRWLCCRCFVCSHHHRRLPA